MRRIVLSPRWCGRHLLLVVLVSAFALLGRWQWGRAMASTGSLQNLLYAFEWWVFAGLVVWGWASMLRDEIRTATRPQPSAPPTPQGPDLPAFAATPRVPDRVADAVDDAKETEADEELAAYNAYLAWLNAHPRR